MARSNINRLIARALVAATVTLGVAARVDAASITFDFTGSSNDGFVGNQRVYTSGGLTVYATAWYWTGSAYAAAGLGRYSGGLAVCNSAEDGISYPCGSPEHSVDNDDQWDFVLFMFSDLVDPTSVYVNRIHDDTDVSYRMGNIVGLDPTQTTFPAGVTGFPWVDDTLSGDNGSRLVTLASPDNAYNFLFLGAYRGTSDRDDFFKIKNLAVDYDPPNREDEVPVPEPATLTLLGLGMSGLAAARRRRAR